MKIEPYKKVGEFAFDINEAEITNVLGMPNRKKLNRVGLVELDYGGLIFRLSPGDDLREVTIEADGVEIGDALVSFRELERYVREGDSQAFESFGFVVSPKFGLAFDPENDLWITVFASGELAKWKKV